MPVTKRILLIDDDPGIQDSLKIGLERVGYEVEVLSDGYAIIEGKTKAPDMYILDRQMTGVNGLDVCRYIKQQESLKHIPVIMFSANPAIGKLAMEAGADDAVEKPFRMKALRAIVAKYFDEHND